MDTPTPRPAGRAPRIRSCFTRAEQLQLRLIEARRDGYITCRSDETHIRSTWWSDCGKRHSPVIIAIFRPKHCSVWFDAWNGERKLTSRGEHLLRALCLEHGGSVAHIYADVAYLNRLPSYAADLIAARLSAWLAAPQAKGVQQ